MENMKNKAKETAKKILELNLSDKNEVKKIKTSIESYGVGIQRRALKMNDILKQPISELAKKGEEGAEVANALMSLQEQIDFLDPSKVNFDKKGLIARFFKPTKKYFKKYEKSEKIIGSIINTLENGSDSLFRDNVFLKGTATDSEVTLTELKEAIEYGIQLDKEISDALLDSETVEKKDFLQKEVIFVIRQRIQDLQQQSLLNQQGILATNIIVKNNSELIRGIERAKNVTVVALNQAVMLSSALADQKIILEQINALNETTTKLLLNTSKSIASNGAAINKQASNSMLDVEVLKESFVALNQAMTDMADYREKALPDMRDAIKELDTLSIEGERSLKRMTVTDDINIDFLN